ncbi:adenine-specific DNA-methyltransferase [Salirhabdus euzebyi]|uniref:Adenine-specific DNA-methyltransferase n=1 Tax=Salirhabdus euzebyi TaxID=394506 RepID=A0A841Q490_9BACI|nr:site-specific DNA-methyltransferase [Salirhabdus euzebyi]MBB6453207.1 adenine-specific DNA-methyltransferase [Salirhabdus euzebyi]
MEKLDGKTFNAVQDNIEKLKEIFPDVFTEDKVDIEKLQLALGEFVEKEKERYEFSWNGKTEAIQLAQKQTTGTLRPKKEDSVNWDTTQNLYIEGDNLEVLRILQHSYRNKVKMIYIDPPYNTGKDFIYQDNFHDNLSNYKEKMNESLKSNAETNGRYHTDWLNMMYPRLKIAKNLLKDDGVIFISIDDNELKNMMAICNEIFGEVNFAGVVTWNKKRKGSFLSKNIVSVTEYCLIYCKNINEAKIVGGVADQSESQPLIKRTNKVKKLRFPRNIIKTKLKDGRYKKGVYGVGSSGVELHEEVEVKDGLIVDELVVSGPFIWTQEKVDEQLALGAAFIINTENFQIRVFKVNEDEKYKGFPSFVDGVEINGTNEDAYEELIELFGVEKIFDYSKPKNYLKKLIQSQTYFEKDGIILDFFSGSAATAHAVMELNAEDGGSRQFIMVQLPEAIDEKEDAYKAGYSNICEIGKQRIRLAGQNITNENVDIGFKVFTLSDTNLRLWNEDTTNLETDLLDLVDPIKEGRTAEDVVYEILLKYDVPLTVPIEEITIAGKRVYSVGMGFLLICLAYDLTLPQIEAMAERKPARIVFYDEGFKDDTVRTNAQQILKRYGVEDIRVI